VLSKVKSETLLECFASPDPIATAIILFEQGHLENAARKLGNIQAKATARGVPRLA